MKHITFLVLLLALTACSPAAFQTIRPLDGGPGNEQVIGDPGDDNQGNNGPNGGGNGGDNNGRGPDVGDGIDDPDLFDQYPCKMACERHSQKVQICHVPRGNPANKHTICIGKSAVAAHFSNHHAANGENDYLGECQNSEDPSETITDNPAD